MMEYTRFQKHRDPEVSRNSVTGVAQGTVLANFLPVHYSPLALGALILALLT